MNRMRRLMQKGFRKDEGFSLIEALVGVALLTIGLLSAGSVLIAVAGQQKLSTIYTTATNLAEDRIESLRHQTYEDIDDDSEDFGAMSEYVSFKRETVVTANAEDTLKTVEVTVTHLNGQTVKLQTLIAR